MSSRYLGIITDGPTDKEIIFKFVESITKNQIVFERIDLTQNFRDLIDTFYSEASKSEEYGLYDEPAKNLLNKLISFIQKGVKEFYSKTEKVGRSLAYYDILILNSDAERPLTSSDRYFDPWANTLNKIFYLAIEKVYNYLQVKLFYPIENIPMIIPFILFPSTDTLVVSAKSYLDSNVTYWGKEARVLKKQIYGVEDLSQLKDGELKEMALNYIEPDSCTQVYKHLPETRLFYKTIACLPSPQMSNI